MGNEERKKKKQRKKNFQVLNSLEKNLLKATIKHGKKHGEDVEADESKTYFKSAKRFEENNFQRRIDIQIHQDSCLKRECGKNIYNKTTFPYGKVLKSGRKTAFGMTRRGRKERSSYNVIQSPYFTFCCFFFL